MWPELGISPTRDAKAIRKAYADRLRVVNKSGDREAFQRLRNAYERAIAYAEAGPKSTEVVNAAVAEADITVRSEQAFQPTEAQETNGHRSEADLLLDSIRAAVEGRNINEALNLFERGLAQGLLPLGWHDEALDQIMQIPVYDPGIESAVFEAVIKRVGWTAEHLGRRLSPVRVAALARLDANRWFKSQVDTARGAGGVWRVLRNSFFLQWPKILLRRQMQRRNAKLLLTGAWQLPRLSKRNIKDLSGRIAFYSVHKNWLKGTLPEQNVQRAEAYVTFYEDWGRAVRYGLVAVFIIPVLYLISLTGAGALPAIWIAIILVRRYLRDV